MNPKSIFLLLTTITLSTAIPFSQQQTQTPTATSTTQTVDPVLSSIIAASASASANNNTCPPSHRSKQCCESVNSIADDITKPLGGLLPLLEGTTISSILGFDCLEMSDTDPNTDCRHDVMCCNGQPGKNAKGGDLFKECEPFDKALADKQNALNRNKLRPIEKAMSYAAMTSSLAASSAAAASSGGLVSRGVFAVPTGQ
ncbi:hypothetical protein BDV23DRAFT_181315 [Aspergillus alliaceus]|uniref:Hydrophobin n=1 Tax=Petromyces alliaceus TaxID=209559 RepID=A0A5N6G2D1_PETAA|nr:uncharacterized protein BDW43DRAFT_309993 [Aspergillus alliaceus]KAB8234733.1 hypothetical protein BDW43DRAFT_309993 [Aspergillus alliaceus]KAE8392626.1 hypothetical protein BDV23DRAFT_181315 [Aspergillus alliaceus]